jgi:hypothetical protein
LEDLTGTQIAERRVELETACAGLLGRLLFEFSRLDTNLGLCLVWVDGGRRLESLTPQVASFGFNKRLEELRDRVEATFDAGSKGREAYSAWLARAHTARTIRNELVHGRWAVDPRSFQVLNIVGLPTSSAQKEVRYSLGDLEMRISDIKHLDAQLNQLRDRWRL